MDRKAAVTDTLAHKSQADLSPEIQSHRRRDIQGLRAIAVLIVVAFHAGLPLPGGFVGVDVFFVISGFVITAMLRREWVTTGRIRLGTFYLRRFKRLAPAVALVTLVTMALSVLLLSPWGTQQNAAKTGMGAMLGTANFAIAATTGGYFDAPAGTNPLLNLWSLSVEEQFYLLFPIALAIGWLLSRRLRVKAVPLVLVGAIAAASGAAMLLGSRGSGMAWAHLLNRPFTIEWAVASHVAVTNGVASDPSWIWGFYSPFTRAWEFSAGAALVLAGAGVKSRSLATALGAGGLSMLVVSVFAINGATAFPGPWTLLPVAGTVLLLLAGSGPSNPAARALSVRPLVAIGDWSYSLYLWHWPLIVFAPVVLPGWRLAPLVAVMVALGIAIVSYRHVERPIRGLPLAGGLSAVGLISLTVVLPLAATVELGRGADRGWGVPEVTQAAATQSAAHDWADCMGEGTDFRSCAWNSDAPGTVVYLLGDSNAAQFVEAARGASTIVNRPLKISALGGCPFLDVYGGEVSNCRSWYEKSMADLVRQPPGLVIIAESSGIWASGGAVSFADRKEELGQGLATTVEQLERAGHSVALVLPVYRFEDPTNLLTIDTRSLFSILREGTGKVVSEDSVNPEQVAVRTLIRSFGSNHGLPVIDLAGYQCPGGRCGLYYEGSPIYQDHSHISAKFSALLAPEFAKVMVSD